MVRIVIASLVLVLSGFPIAAVVCDVFLCIEPSAASASCHEHETTGSGDRLTSESDRCSHLTVFAPFVTSSSRVIVDLGIAIVVGPPTALIAAVARHDESLHAHAPPRIDSIPRLHPLRI